MSAQRRRQKALRRKAEALGVELATIRLAPSTVPDAERVAAEAPGKPVSASDGKPLGTVNHAWVKDGWIMAEVTLDAAMVADIRGTA